MLTEVVYFWVTLYFLWQNFYCFYPPKRPLFQVAFDLLGRKPIGDHLLDLFSGFAEAVKEMKILMQGAR